MITVPRSETPFEPGHWWLTLMDGETKTAWMMCPNGHSATLLDHTIAADGKVSPSVVCLEDDCGWHEHVRLKGWS